MAGVQSDLDLVCRAQRTGGEASLADLVERYQRPLYNFFLRSLRNPAISEELFQETFLRALRGLDGFDAQDPAANFRAWLYRIALHLARDEHRRQELRASSTPSRAFDLPIEAEGPADPEGAASLAQQRARVRQAVAALPALAREVVLLHQYQGFSYQEIAEVLEVPLGTVKSRMHSALQSLRRALVEEDEGAQEVAS